HAREPSLPRRAEADVGGYVAKAAIAHVLEKHRRRIRVQDEQVEVASVVVVGGHDAYGMRPASPDAGFGRDVAELPAAVVPQQPSGVAGSDDEDVEIAVVIHV